ncbi:MAG: hypothetical protein ABI604_10155 [Nitrospirota bacterium]
MRLTTYIDYTLRALIQLAVTGFGHSLERHGAGQAGNRDPVASQRFPPLLAAAIKGRPAGTAQVGH